MNIKEPNVCTARSVRIKAKCKKNKAPYLYKIFLPARSNKIFENCYSATPL